MPRELPAGVIVRAANAEEMEDFRFVANIALAEHGVPERDPVTYLRPEWSTCVFEHGQLATTFGAWPFSMRFNGERAAIAGVTAVGTLPTKRRRGYLRAAMEYSLTEQYERGQSLAVLYASQAAIYQRFGYAVCSNRCSYEIDPLDLHFIHYPEPRGELSVSNAADLPDDAQVIRDLYRAFAAPRHGLVHRGRDTWDAEALAEPDDIHEGPIRCLLYEEDGQPLGYMLYTSAELREYSTITGGQRDHRTTVREYGWLTPAAYIAMWQFIAAHDLVWRVYVNDAPEDDPLFVYARDPRTLRRKTSDGVLVRIVDLARALSIRPYPAEGSVSFRVHDDLCDWNDATWALDVGPEGSDIRQTDAEPDFSLDIHSMAQLITGHLSASYLARLGRLDVTNRSALARADAIFATEYRMHCMNHF